MAEFELRTMHQHQLLRNRQAPACHFQVQAQCNGDGAAAWSHLTVSRSHFSSFVFLISCRKQLWAMRKSHVENRASPRNWFSLRQASRKVSCASSSASTCSGRIDGNAVLQICHSIRLEDEIFPAAREGERTAWRSGPRAAFEQDIYGGLQARSCHPGHSQG
jgi:hypothetical protein